MTFDPIGGNVENEDIPNVDLSEQRVYKMLRDIKRNARNRRIALFTPVLLAVAVLGAMIAAPARHGGLALIAEAEMADPQLPRVFGSNGVWSLAEPIEEAPVIDPGIADMIQAPTEMTAPLFTLSPPDKENLNSIPTSMSTPPVSTSGQSPDMSAASFADEWANPADVDWSAFRAAIRIESNEVERDANSMAASTDWAAEVLTPVQTTATSDTPSNGPEDSLSDDLDKPDDGDATVAVKQPRTKPQDLTEANPSTPTDDPVDTEVTTATLPATIIPHLVLVYGAHVSVTVQVVDDDSSVIDWCNTRIDWGDGSISRVVGADDAALCTAFCEYESTSSAASEIDADGSKVIDENILFEHEYARTTDAAPRIFVATGDGCSYTLVELQLRQFTVVPVL
ncbi:MAG: hypothetical protein ACKVK3_14890 [Acidimicrobiales bacterium]